MTVKLNDSGCPKQFPHDEIYLSTFSKVYFCLENESRLTQEEKIRLMQYPEEIVKEAMEEVLNSFRNKPLSEQLEIYCRNKINPKHLFFCKHKILVGITISIGAIAAAVFYAYMPKPGCIEGFRDNWTDSICKNGELIPSSNEGFPDRISFRKLIEGCTSGAQIPGCFHRNYYRELTLECRDNPAASLCDGKYGCVHLFGQPMQPSFLSL